MDQRCTDIDRIVTQQIRQEQCEAVGAVRYYENTEDCPACKREAWIKGGGEESEETKRLRRSIWDV